MFLTVIFQLNTQVKIIPYCFKQTLLRKCVALSLAFTYFSALSHALGPNGDDEIIPKYCQEPNLEPETVVKSAAMLLTVRTTNDIMRS
jgi:hypothetical protein